VAAQVDRSRQWNGNHAGVLAGIKKAQKIRIGFGDQRYPGSAFQIQPHQLPGDAYGFIP
jgi:hypothetical protein